MLEFDMTLERVLSRQPEWIDISKKGRNGEELRLTFVGKHGIYRFFELVPTVGLR